MMGTQLFWIEGPWLGKLALAARPRGGEWLENEMAAWRNAGIDVVLSLLTEEEEASLELLDERTVAQKQTMEFRSLPIEDRQVPSSPSELAKTLEFLDDELSRGKNLVIHCRQGIGRTGLVGACLLVARGLAPKQAIKQLSQGRGLKVPETEEQRRWIDFYASTLAESNDRAAAAQGFT